MSPLNHRPRRGDYWRSLAELEQTPEFAEFLAREFPQQALLSPLSRRHFAQLMGASFAFAGLGAGCRWNKEEIAPLSRRPEGHTPGVPKRYNTAMDLGGAAWGLRVTSYDGRPVKVEGNPEHPFTGGATTTFAQASILELYDPDRSGRFVHADGEASASDFLQFARDLLQADVRLRVLSEATSSPTVDALRRELVERHPLVKWHEYEPVSRDNERAGTRIAFGEPHRPIAKMDRAKTILALDGDFLVDHPASLRYARDFATGRRPEDGPMNRLYAVESTFSHTGAAADHRLPLRSELILPFAMALEASIRGAEAPAAAFLAEEHIAQFVQAVATDLRESGRESLVIAGPRQPPEVHALCARLNDALGCVGHTVSYVADPDPDRPSHVEALSSLMADIVQGEVDALLIIGGNPAFDAPSNLNFAGALSMVETTMRLGYYEDETSALCTWHVPRTHYLESWGDARAYDGTISLAQPLTEPLRAGTSVIEVLAALMNKDDSAESLVREDFARRHPTSEWRRALHDGWVRDSAFPEARPSLGSVAPANLDDRQRGGTQLSNGELEVVFTPSSHVYDGRFANNGWLQETPDFMTRMTWDNVALISPKTAADLGIANETLLRLYLDDRSVVVPAYVMPGQAPYSIALAVGHGRTRAGRVGGLADEGVASPGFNVYPLRSAEAMDVARGLSVETTRQSVALATVQDHWAIDKVGQKGIAERLDGLVRTTTVEEYADPDFHYAVHGPKLESLFRRHRTLTAETTGHRWGMATDLSTCIGCNACTVACQAENNVPIVGKEQVLVSREMHWIRIDRYFRGDPEDPQIAHQPVTCQQCEMAPCEEVCPVGATVHSDEGLNEMVYNRCVGTRYCSNNCPYKVRRFNFFHWHDESGTAHENLEDPRNKIRKLMFNPEVTIRSRGVMEKCSFCVQRIESARISATSEGRALVDGDIVSACMQACPTSAIVFGDLSDPESRVSRLHDKQTYKRGYALLAELNTAPRNTYLAKVRNPNPSLTESR